MNKKNTIIKILSILVIFFSLAYPALAATVSLSPSPINITRGQSVNVAIVIEPRGEPIYTAKVELKFPANLVSVSSFTYGNGLMPLGQSGYDLTDNANGVLIKSAGYPGGISTPIILGTVRLSSKESGNGLLNITANSLVYNSVNNNVLTGLPASASIVVSPVATQPKATQPKTGSTQQNSGNNETTTQASTNEQPTTTLGQQQEESPQITTENTQEAGETGGNSFLASIGSFFSLGTGNVLVGLIMALIILAAIYLIVLGIRNYIMKPKGN